MNHWILQVNPNRFHLTRGAPSSYYQPGEDDWWGISRYFKVINPGDIVLVWHSLDYRNSFELKPRGFYAKALDIPYGNIHRIYYVKGSAQ